MSIWVDVNGWPVPPLILLGCLAVEILYFRGWCVLVKDVQSKDTARAIHVPVHNVSDSDEASWNHWLWRGIFFLGAILVFLLAASAPIDTLSGRLFWVHMIQHLLLLVVMAPLLVAAAPLMPLWLGLPNWVRRCVMVVAKQNVGHIFYQIGHWLRQPVISCLLLVIGTWVWHWPALYDLALTNETIHDWCEHTIFLAVSVLFWTQVLPSYPLRPRLGYLGRIGCIGIAIVQNVALAVLIGFAQVPLYAPYAHQVISGGFTALQDQQFGAGIMWTFGDVPFGIALSMLVQKWLIAQSDDAIIAPPSYRSSEVPPLEQTERAAHSDMYLMKGK
jgi:cytochrome c oxidase assembly factor CtaG